MNAPDWDLLPHGPISFFELSDDFDRKQLRRGYSRLIKQFKPETHANEFQRIRQAYEQLDGELRYGQQSAREDERLMASMVMWSEALETHAEEAESENEVTVKTRRFRDYEDEKGVAPKPDAANEEPAPQREAPDPTAAPPSPNRTRRFKDVTDEPGVPHRRDPLWQRVLDERPKDIYRELAKSSQRTPYDYYALAVLSDVVDRQQESMFLRWLLTGLAEHKEEPGLLSLLSEFFRTELPDKEIRKALLATAKVIGNDRFFFATESLWLRYIGIVPFNEFTQTLEQCEHQLTDHHVQGRIAFHVQIIRAAMWKGDESWIEERIQWVDSHSEELSDVLEYELEIVSTLLEYRKIAKEFLDGSRARANIDKPIRAYCEKGLLEAVHIAIICQDELARDAQGVMESMPMSSRQVIETAMRAHQMVIAEILELIDLNPVESTEKQIEKQTLSLLHDTRQELEPIGGQILKAQVMIQCGIGGLIVLGPPILLFGLLSFLALFYFSLVWIALSLAAFFLILKPNWTTPMLERKIHRLVSRAYANSWRPRLFRFFQAVTVNYGVGLQGIVETSAEVGDDEWIGWLIEFAVEDEGLSLYAFAQAFLT